MTWTEAFDRLGLVVANRSELLAAGATGRGLTTAVRGGYLVRVRRDRYALPAAADHIMQAVRVGGRLTCVSALRINGIFAFDTSRPHIHLDRSVSRPRAPRNRRQPLALSDRSEAKVHWWPLVDSAAGTEYSVGIEDALSHAIRCQTPPLAIASIDNALHQGTVSFDEVAGLLHGLPRRHLMLLDELDGRAEAGQESILRLLVRELGLHCELQVEISGVGRADMVVEGILILEADSRLAHHGWELHIRDRNRDIDAARQGYMSLRPAYQRTMFDPVGVQEAVMALLAAWNHHRVHIL